MIPFGLDIARAFVRVVGPAAVTDLMASFTERPVLLLSGGQLTGKSATARILAERLGGAPRSSGSIVRSMAAECGISVEEMGRLLAADPDSDVRIDHEAARVIAHGEAVVFESRLAGHLGAWLRELGRRRLFSVHLMCSPRERFVRFVYREVSAEASRRVSAALPSGWDIDPAEELRVLRALADADAQRIERRMVEASGRDAEDRWRLAGVYGFDYGERSPHDATIDTSPLTVLETADRIWGLLGGAA
jgi:cytidylate kinase